jgi:putative transposase
MPDGLVRVQQTGLPHFVTFSCVRHRPLLGTAEARDIFCELLEHTRLGYEMEVLAYVVMPNHVHLIVHEPREKPLATALQIVKQRFSRTRAEEFVWEPRYYDFNLRTGEKGIEKLRYIHCNPVKCGLVASPEEWKWSSYRDYAGLGPGPVAVRLGRW